MQNFIEIKSLEKNYNGTKAVYDFNLDIKKNEFIVIVGPSGCGKSTTLRMVAGLEDISSGELYIDGELVNNKPSKDRKVAIVFQNYALYPQMNVFENIAFPLTVNKYLYPKVHIKLRALNEAKSVLTNQYLKEIILESKNKKQTKITDFVYLAKKLNIDFESAKVLLSYKIDKKDYNENLVKEITNDLETKIAQEQKLLLEKNQKINDNYEYLDDNLEVIKEYRKLSKYEIEDKVFHTAEILNLGDYLNRLPKQLSGGQMQRVALGRAIVKDVPIFLMDEPLSNLDAKLRLNMRSEIVKLHKRINATTIYVTHDQTEAMTMANRIVVMSKGFIQQIDTPSKIYNNPCNIFVAKFIGSPTINVLKTEIAGNKVKIAENLDIELDEKQLQKIKDFYVSKATEFRNHLDHYHESDEHRVFILKVISSLDEKNDVILNKNKKHHKKDTQEIDEEYLILKEKTLLLEEATKGIKNIILTIRPEKLLISPCDKTKKGEIIFTPDVTELLGNEYQIHFSLGGFDLIGKADTKKIVDNNTLFTLKINNEDCLFFDPITGGRII